MTNIDRAAEVVAWEYAAPDLRKSTVDPSVLITQALADATPPLLIPDLPEPDYTGSITAWMADDPVLTVTAHSILGVSLISEVNEQGVGGAEVNLTVEGARTVALALLAAADYAERNQK